jgi:hypothetical protein
MHFMVNLSEEKGTFAMAINTGFEELEVMAIKFKAMEADAATTKKESAANESNEIKNLTTFY